MFEKIRKTIKNLQVEPVPFDPSTLGDELAQRTDWTPAKGGGSNFRTHEVVRPSPQRLEFKPTSAVRAFCLLFIGIGVVTSGTFVVLALTGAFGGLNPLIPLGIASVGGLMSVAVGVGMLWWASAPIVLDQSRGEFWKGRASPANVTHPQELENYAKLDQVRAIQIVAERCKTNDGSYMSYEMNLVLDHGGRLNVVDHGELELLRKDARTVAEFLGVPVWDATAASVR